MLKAPYSRCYFDGLACSIPRQCSGREIVEIAGIFKLWFNWMPHGRVYAGYISVKTPLNRFCDETSKIKLIIFRLLYKTIILPVMTLKYVIRMFSL